MLKDLLDLALAVAVQTLMLMQVSFGYWRLCRKARAAPCPWALGAGRMPAPGAKLSVVIPAYRERATIEATLRRAAAGAGRTD